MTDKTTLTIKPNEVVRFQFDNLNYADLSIDIEGNLTVHNLCGKYPSIIDKTVYGITKTLEVGAVKKFKELGDTPPTDRPLKVGDVLVCIGIDNHYCKLFALNGKYKILSINSPQIHFFDIVFSSLDEDKEISVSILKSYIFKNFSILEL